ncbi:hypothetical protein J437_LFUL004292 [Ladona fulva]|uniref:Uncharacterized protein n=1 Tax=Ladona fulva TaxID=123851 RepID=A0A8K0JXX2_LADFU|nr:hypothetical protein J437_LFUL004292 [Ladona fulva]
MFRERHKDLDVVTIKGISLELMIDYDIVLMIEKNIQDGDFQRVDLQQDLENTSADHPKGQILKEAAKYPRQLHYRHNELT